MGAYNEFSTSPYSIVFSNIHIGFRTIYAARPVRVDQDHAEATGANLKDTNSRENIVFPRRWVDQAILTWSGGAAAPMAKLTVWGEVREKGMGKRGRLINLYYDMVGLYENVLN